MHGRINGLLVNEACVYALRLLVFLFSIFVTLRMRASGRAQRVPIRAFNLAPVPVSLRTLRALRTINNLIDASGVHCTYFKMRRWGKSALRNETKTFEFHRAATGTAGRELQFDTGTQWIHGYLKNKIKIAPIDCLLEMNATTRRLGLCVIRDEVNSTTRHCETGDVQMQWRKIFEYKNAASWAYVLLQWGTRHARTRASGARTAKSSRWAAKIYNRQTRLLGADWRDDAAAPKPAPAGRPNESCPRPTDASDDGARQRFAAGAEWAQSPLLPIPMLATYVWMRGHGASKRRALPASAKNKRLVMRRS